MPTRTSLLIMVGGFYTWAIALAMLAFPPIYDGDTVKSLLVAIGGAGAAYGGWRLRALAIEKANADALDRRVGVLERELLDERDQRNTAEKRALVLEGEIKALEARPDLDGLADALSAAFEKNSAEHNEILAVLERIASAVGGRRRANHVDEEG